MKKDDIIVKNKQKLMKMIMIIKILKIMNQEQS